MNRTILLYCIILFFLITGTVLATPVNSDPVISLSGNDSGLRFDGVGGISAGASSRLLYDYPEPERSQILDYLFKPRYGASLQLLKIEIGGDLNSTDGSEPSHMRTPDEINCDRGYEWWLVKEARARNPKIKIVALAWGAPGWVGKFWSDATIKYIMAWLECARSKGIKIDYVGGWNEKGWDAEWYIALDKALEQFDPQIQILGADDSVHPWSIATEMTKNPRLKQVIDVVGDHGTCGWRSASIHCPSSDDAMSLGKPLWSAEQSSLGHDVGAAPLARALNRLYIHGKITGSMVWSLVSAWYANFHIADTGLLLAEWPWSGFYRVGKSIWVNAHTTQFVEPGWKYMDHACGFLSSGASYVSLKSSDASDYTTVVEAMDAKGSQKITFSVKEGLSQNKEVNLWSSNMRSDNPKDHFVFIKKIKPENGTFSLLVEPDYLYTLSTTTGQYKGTERPAKTIGDLMPLPYKEDFEGYTNGKIARYFSDLNGSFEIASCSGGRMGHCYRQVVTQQPISWQYPRRSPSTILGEARWWGDYEVSADVLLEGPGYVELIGRLAVQVDTTLAGYHLQVDSDGKWNLLAQDCARFGQWNKVLASGNSSFKAGEWHKLALAMKGKEIKIFIDGKQVGRAEDDTHITGQVGFLVSPWQKAQFDNFKITQLGKWPRFIPQQNLKVSATSDHPENWRGYDYRAENAIDDRPETSWHTDWETRASLPQSITFDLGADYKITQLLYQPGIEVSSRIRQPKFVANDSGMITEYTIYVSTDGKQFTKIYSGSWKIGSSSKVARWPQSHNARYVRLEVTKAIGNAAAAGEIRIGID